MHKVFNSLRLSERSASLVQKPLSVILNCSSPKDLYSRADLRTIINEYTASHSLANAREQQYIHPDELLLSVLVAPKSEETLPYLKRDETVKRLSERMQSWHEVVVDGKDPVIRYVYLEFLPQCRRSVITLFLDIQEGSIKAYLCCGQSQTRAKGVDAGHRLRDFLHHPRVPE
jgi:hypothetical protein